MQKTDGRAAGQAVGGPVGGRIYLMDELRGFAVFCMVFYHGFYTFAYLFHWAFGEALLRFFMPAEPWFAGLFILISGISSNLSHSNLARGAKLLVIALAVSLVTGLVVPQERILFGILHFLSVCMLLFGGLEALRKKRGRPALSLGGAGGVCGAFCADAARAVGICRHTLSAGDPAARRPVRLLAFTAGILQPGLFFGGLFPAAALGVYLFCRDGAGAVGGCREIPPVRLPVPHSVFFLDRAPCTGHLCAASAGDLRAVVPGPAAAVHGRPVARGCPGRGLGKIKITVKMTIRMRRKGKA